MSRQEHRNSGRNWLYRRNVIRGNFLHDLIGLEGRYCKGVYLDDCFSQASIVSNRFLRTTYSVFLSGSRDILIEGNVFEDSPDALHIDVRGYSWSRHRMLERLNELRKQGTIYGLAPLKPPYVTRYPELKWLEKYLTNEPDESYFLPSGNVVRGNVFRRGAGVWLGRYYGNKGVRKANHVNEEDKLASEKGVPTEWWKHVYPDAWRVLDFHDNVID